MPHKLTVPPALEPVTLAQARAHLRVEQTAEDSLIERLIITARQEVERLSNMQLMTQSWACYLDCWPPEGIIHLPLMPVQNVIALNVIDAQNIAQTIDPAYYQVDLLSQQARIHLQATGGWSALLRKFNGIEIVLSTGFGDQPEDVPQPLRQAILLLIAHWFENRGETNASVPVEVSRLIAGYKVVRL